MTMTLNNSKSQGFLRDRVRRKRCWKDSSRASDKRQSVGHRATSREVGRESVRYPQLTIKKNFKRHDAEEEVDHDSDNSSQQQQQQQQQQLQPKSLQVSNDQRPEVNSSYTNHKKKRHSKAKNGEKRGIQGLNQAFAQLKNLVPRLPSDKLSKIQTVRLATFYIDFLFKLSANSAVDSHRTSVRN